MAIIFPNPAGQTPVNTFSPTSTPFDTSTTSNLTYIWDPALGVWTSTAGGGGGGGVTSLTGTPPITIGGTASVPVIGINDATSGTKGAVSVGANLQVTAGAISVPDASDTTKGVSEIATAAEAATGTDATRTLSPATGVPKVLADMTGAAIIPGGDDAERAAITTPTAGMLRYNDQGGTPVAMEYYNGSAWVDLATGGGGLGVWNLTTTGLSSTNANNNLIQYLGYGNGKFLAIDAQGNASSSADGITWSAQVSTGLTDTTNVTTGRGDGRFTFANGVFVICGQVGGGWKTATSPDGVTWTLGALLPNDLIVAGDGGVFVGNDGNAYYTSTDGRNWTATGQTDPFGVQQRFMLGGGGIFLSVGNNAAVYTSTNGGVTWNATGTLFFGGNSQTYSGFYANGEFVFTGANWLCRTTNGVGTITGLNLTKSIAGNSVKQLANVGNTGALSLAVSSDLFSNYSLEFIPIGTANGRSIAINSTGTRVVAINGQNSISPRCLVYADIL